MSEVTIKRTTRIENKVEEVVEEIRESGISDAAHKQWMTKLRKIIAELRSELDNSIAYSDHQRWMTRKDNEIKDLKNQIEKLEKKLHG